MAPTVQNAVVIQQDGSTALREIPVPKPGPDEILVKVVAAAQNPADCGCGGSSLCALAQLNFVFGLFREVCTVRQACRSSLWVRLLGNCRGDRVKRSAWSALGRRARRRFSPWRSVILSSIVIQHILRSHILIGAGPQRSGAFCEYLVTYADFVVHLPDAWSFEDAAQLGIAPLTALMALYDLLELPEFFWHEAAVANPPTPPFPILISGGASSVGQYAVQFAKLSGLYVIATASERNFSLVRSLGADVVVDYRDPVKAAQQIRDAAPRPVEHAVDCVSMGTSFEIVAASLDGKGTIANLTLGSYPLVEGARVLSGVIFDYFGKVRFRL